MKVNIFENETNLKIPFKNKTHSKCYVPDNFVFISMEISEGMCKPYYSNQDFSPLANWVYFKVIVKKIPLHNENSPIMDPITKIRVAHTVKSRAVDRSTI